MTTLLITSTSSGIGARLAARHHFPPNITVLAFDMMNVRACSESLADCVCGILTSGMGIKGTPGNKKTRRSGLSRSNFAVYFLSAIKKVDLYKLIFPVTK